MDDFMRLAGVVGERIKCHAFEDGHTQLVSLNEYCWSAIGLYLDLDDIQEWLDDLNKTADGHSSIWTSEDNGCPPPRLPPHCYPVAVPCGSNLLPGNDRRPSWCSCLMPLLSKQPPPRRWKRWYTASSVTVLPCSSTLHAAPTCHLVTTDGARGVSCLAPLLSKQTPRHRKRRYPASRAMLLPCSSTLRSQPAVWKRPTALVVQLPDGPAVQTALYVPPETGQSSVHRRTATL
ncbi:uncharacterized protein LOC144133329 [Amblyomma americanum]